MMVSTNPWPQNPQPPQINSLASTDAEIQQALAALQILQQQYNQLASTLGNLAQQAQYMYSRLQKLVPYNGTNDDGYIDYTVQKNWPNENWLLGPSVDTPFIDVYMGDNPNITFEAAAGPLYALGALSESENRGSIYLDKSGTEGVPQAGIYEESTGNLSLMAGGNDVLTFAVGDTPSATLTDAAGPLFVLGGLSGHLGSIYFDAAEQGGIGEDASGNVAIGASSQDVLEFQIATDATPARTTLFSNAGALYLLGPGVYFDADGHCGIGEDVAGNLNVGAGGNTVLTFTPGSSPSTTFSTAAGPIYALGGELYLDSEDNYGIAINPGGGDVPKGLELSAGAPDAIVFTQVAFQAAAYWSSDGTPGQSITTSGLVFKNGLCTSGSIGAPLSFKGTIDCSDDPDYPAGTAGDLYVCSDSGNIGGSSGATVEATNLIICLTTNAGGSEASVGGDWDVVSSGTSNAIVGPSSAVDGNFVAFNGTSGNIVEDSGYNGTTLGVVTTGAWNADTIAIAYGGTGLTSVGTPYQLLIVNGAGNALEYVTLNGITEVIWFAPTSGGGGIQIVLGVLPVANGGTGLDDVGADGTILFSDGTGCEWADTTNITEVGTITTGAWEATVVGTEYGGTGLDAVGGNGALLQSNGTSLQWHYPLASDIGLGSVENTALSTWHGSTYLVTVGTVTAGTWTAGVIGASYGGTGLASAGTAGNFLQSTGSAWQSVSVLGVSNGGTGIQSVGSVGQVLTTVSTTTTPYLGWRTPASGVPTYTSGNANEFLQVNSSGSALTWHTLVAADVGLGSTSSPTFGALTLTSSSSSVTTLTVNTAANGSSLGVLFQGAATANSIFEFNNTGSYQYGTQIFGGLYVAGAFGLGPGTGMTVPGTLLTYPIVCQGKGNQPFALTVESGGCYLEGGVNVVGTGLNVTGGTRTDALTVNGVAITGGVPDPLTIGTVNVTTALILSY
jgi:hypothetical protein